MSDPLEELILEQLTALSLSTEPDTVEFVKGIVEEDTIEAEVRFERLILDGWARADRERLASQDKKMAIIGLLELDEDG